MLKIVLGLFFLLVNLHASEFEAHEQINYLFFGAFAMIIVYNFGHYVITKSATYADYFLFHGLVFVIMLFHTGTFNDELLEFSLYGVPVGLFFLAVSSILAFSRDFLELEKFYPQMIRPINTLIIINLALLGFSAFAIYNALVEALVIAFVISISLGLLSLSAYMGFIKKHIDARFYFFAFLGLFLNIVLVFLSYFNLLDLSDKALYFFEAGILVEASIFSFALSHQQKMTLLNLKQNELLFKELSHRVKNNLQQIISILSLQVSSAKGLEAKAYLEDTISRIGSISLIHKTLENSTNVSKVNMDTYLHDLLKGYHDLHTKINFNFKCDKTLFLEVEKITPLALILNELITNSIKHAFKETQNPSVEIVLKSKDTFSFSYKDNGSGFKQEEVVSSLGSKLITILSTGQLKGEMSVHTDKGYHFSLNFS